MMPFVTISSMFVGNATLLIVYTVSAEVDLAVLPLLGSCITGMALKRALMTPPRQPNTKA